MLSERFEENYRRATQGIIDNPWRAHTVFFAHRHPTEPASFHPELVADFWSSDRYSQVLAFRGGAKSTYGEEDICLAAALPVFRNILIIGASETRAAERLASISYELKNNDLLIEWFGRQEGTSWTQTKIVTSKNVCIQAMGRDQDIRGIKHLEWRPDFVFVDDFEDKDNVQSPEGRAKTLRWFLAELLPACAPSRKVRVRATPMDPESVPMRLQNVSGWPTRTFPIETLDEAGERRATWPALFPLSWIDEEKTTYVRLGEMQIWNREYMCEAVSDSDRTFSKEMIRVEPRERSWQAVYAMIDPARTTNRQSATTGWAVWSWINNRLIVWAAGAAMLKPDEIIDLTFTLAREYNPVWIGVEEDGLNEFLLQPIRHEQVRRGVTIPFRPLRAPRGKLDFIRGLQPFFSAREVVFANPLPDLEAQLLGFPTGRIDAPNALAYALQMRPAAPVYDGFSEESIADELEPDPSRPLYLAANATRATTTAILCQHYGGQLRVYADWVIEGAPAESVSRIHAEAALFGDAALGSSRRSRYDWREALKLPSVNLTYQRIPPRWIVPPHHGNEWNNVGLEQAIRQIPASVSRASGPEIGQQVLRQALRQSSGGGPGVQISARAAWTLRALAGGYCRSVRKGGGVADYAEEGPYRVLMEGLESFVGITAAFRDDGEDNAQPISYDRQGRPYRSAMPARR